MRLFVAIELPERVRTAVEDLASRMKRTLPPARWVAGPNLHLTLAFLGEIDEQRLPALATGLSAGVAGHSPLSLRVRGAGCFPPRGKARVAWLGIDHGAELERLHRSLVASLQASVGLEPERRPFQAHLTAARCNPPWPASAGRRWSASVDGPVGEAFRAGSVSLMRSRLGKSGASYTRVHRFTLGEVA